MPEQIWAFALRKIHVPPIQMSRYLMSLSFVTLYFLFFFFFPFVETLRESLADVKKYAFKVKLMKQPEFLV